jgi:Ca2+:H+ antiporter
MQRILYASLVTAPVVIALDRLGAGDVLIFVVAAIALIPLAWLIGEATEHASHHTGPGIGGFINATFGNAPELIIALFAVSNGLADVVRGSLTGSVVGNLLLVLGFSLAFGGRGELDRWSTQLALVLVTIAGLAFLVPAIPSWTGNPERHSLAVVSLPISIALLAIYVVITRYSLKRHRDTHAPEHVSTGWSFRVALAVLAVATVLTAFVAQALVGSIETFAHSAGLSEFFVAAVIVAIVGNAAEHGGAVVVAAHGRLKLAAEIALASSAQVAVFLIPAVQLLSWAVKPALPLSFRPVEIGALLGATAFVTVLVGPGHATRGRGLALIVGYVGVAVAFYIAGDRN